MWCLPLEESKVPREPYTTSFITVPPRYSQQVPGSGSSAAECRTSGLKSHLQEGKEEKVSS